MMTRRTVCGLAAVTLLWLAVSARAQQPGELRVRLGEMQERAASSVKAPLATPLGISDAVRLAMERNLDLKIQRLNIPMAQSQIRQAEGEFDPLAGLGASYGQQKRFPVSLLEENAYKGLVRDETFTPSASLDGKLTLGTQYAFSLSGPQAYSDNPLRLFNDTYQANLSLTLTQPLLRGFGFAVNLVSVRIAEKNERQALADLEARMLQVIQEVEVRYWSVVFAQQHVDVGQGNLALAQDLVIRLERGRQGGVATTLDVAQAQSAVEARRAELARAEADLASARANLRLLIDPRGPQSSTLLAVDRPPEEGAPSDLPGLLARAAAKRPELRSQQLVIDRLTLLEAKAVDNTRPSLSLIGTGGYSGVSGSTFNPSANTQLIQGPLPNRNTYLDAWSGMYTIHGPYSWLVGLQLQMPIGNRQAEGILTQTRIQRQQEEYRLEQLKGQLGVGVETAFEATRTAWDQLASARESVRVARLQEDATQRDQSAGRATVRQILEAQQYLALTLDAENQALTSYASARARLEAASTQSFQRYGLLLER
jgi:outer membrane protein